MVKSFFFTKRQKNEKVTHPKHKGFLEHVGDANNFCTAASSKNLC